MVDLGSDYISAILNYLVICENNKTNNARRAKHINYCVIDMRVGKLRELRNIKRYISHKHVTRTGLY